MAPRYTTRILHISDIHFRSAEGSLPQERINQIKREEWKRYRVLGTAWEKNLNEILTGHPRVDLVCVTGDVADWGIAQEYKPATDFLSVLLKRLELDSDRLYVVPGNHDIHRKTEEGAWDSLRDIAARLSTSAFSNWMAGGPAPFGVNAGLRDLVLKRSDAYREWLEKHLRRPELLSSQSAHGLLGYKSRIQLPGRPFPIHIIGLDSSWLAGDDNDAGKLRLTEDQVGILATDSGRQLDGFRLALVHHPLTELADGVEVRRLLAEHTDLLLRGHQHEALTETWADPQRRLLELAAGCLYEGTEGHRHPNAFQLIDVTTNEEGRPLEYSIRFRGWSPRGYWFDDASLYSEAREGRLTIRVGAPLANEFNQVDHRQPNRNAERPEKDSQNRPSPDKENRVSLGAASTPRTTKRGNILGELTGEADKTMLSGAFYESSVFLELIAGSDYRFVVGRRGAGKSALFQKIAERLRQETRTHLLTEKPQEDTARALQGMLKKVADSYAASRHITRLTWKVQILTAALEKLRTHYKVRNLGEAAFFETYMREHSAIFSTKGMERSLQVLEAVFHDKMTADELPRAVAKHFRVEELKTNVGNVLQELGHRVIFLYDGLDEGWVPEPIETGVLGGLAKASAELREADLPISCTLFVRDNMLRALAYLDNDYTRNIEGSTLRLQWDEESLFRLVVKRLRTAFGWAGDDMKMWNHFAQRGLQGKEGFRTCLRSTLYRPRDVIALLNSAYQVAWQAGRESIIESDLEATSVLISRDRLNDLFREYDRVLPGLQAFVGLFASRKSIDEYGNILKMLSDVAEGPLSGNTGKEFALLGTGAEIFSALYSVGFLGVKDESAEGFRFCHDGSNADLRTLEPTREVAIHPCYWKALEVIPAAAAESVVMKVDDSDDIAKRPTTKNELVDRRTKLLGETVSELHKIRPGWEDSDKFDRWAQRAVQLVFGEQLDNVERRPNPHGPQRRNVIVATINTNKGFWARASRDYGVRQCLWIAENSEELHSGDFEQIWSMLGGVNGRLAFVVRQGKEKILSRGEKRLIRLGLDENDKLVVVLSAEFLKRALSKMRNELKQEYAEDRMHTLLSQLERGQI
ncbi:metallophosphoesterase family protein [Corallococcus sp. M7]